MSTSETTNAPVLLAGRDITPRQFTAALRGLEETFELHAIDG